MSSIETKDQAGAADYGIAPPGYRLPPALRVGAVRLGVSDLARSLDYYQNVLGLRVVDREQGGARLGSESGEVLVELEEKQGARPVALRGRIGLYHFAILLPDRGSLGRFVQHLGELGEPAGSSDHLVSEALYLRDPDGLGIEVYVDRPRSTWRFDARQLVMATNPLDLADLVRAGDGRPWTGMPQGTVMGHIHLHVGDLDAAAAFYHVALGLDQTVWGYPGALFLSAGGYHHHLGVNTWAAGAQPAGENDARLLEWVIALPSVGDVAQAAASIGGAGHALQRDGDAFTVADPWGTRLRIVADTSGPA